MPRSRNVKIGAEEAEFAELRDQVLWECAFAAVLFDNGIISLSTNWRALADKLFFVVELRIKVDEIDTGKEG